MLFAMELIIYIAFEGGFNLFENVEKDFKANYF